MKKVNLKIKRFKEIANVELSLPAILSGDNGTGKTSVIHAFYWVIDGKNEIGKKLDEKIYTQHGAYLEDYFAEVSLSIDDVTFTRKCVASEKDNEIIKTLTTSLSINEKGITSIVTVDEWSRQISLFFPDNFRNYIAPDYFFSHEPDPRGFLLKIFDFSPFDTTEKDKGKERLDILAKEISNISAVILNNQNKLDKTGDVAIVDDLSTFYQKKIQEVNDKRIANTPHLTEDEKKCNELIFAEIEKIKAKQLILNPYAEQLLPPTRPTTKDMLPEIAEVEIIPFPSLSKIDEVSLKVKNANAINEEIKKTKADLENYDIISVMECARCSKCTDMECSFRSAEGMTSREDLRLFIEKTPGIEVDPLNKELTLLLLDKNAYEENEKARVLLENKKIREKNEEIKKKNAANKVYNENVISEYNDRLAKINNENKIIAEQNDIIKNENEKILKSFEEERQAEIKELQQKIILPKTIDDEKLEENLKFFQLELEKNKIDFQNFLKISAIRDTLISENENLRQKMSQLKADKAIAKVEFENLKLAEDSYYLAFEKKINDIFSEFDIVFHFFKKLKGSGELAADFSCEVGGNKYLSNGEFLILKNVLFCLKLQEISGVTLPVIVDEVAILGNDYQKKLMEVIADKLFIIAKLTDEKKLTIKK